MTIVPIRKIAALSYAGHANEMIAGSKLREDVRDRAAYVYITGQFPSHLRTNFMGILRAITASWNKPVAMDGRSGSIRVASDAATDLDLDSHPMVREVRAKIADGYVIQPSRGQHARRPYTHVFMYRPTRKGNDLVTVTSEGAIKAGWD